MRKIDIGNIGETFIIHELSKKGIYSIKLNPLFDYDILTQNNQGIEVKTSTIRVEKSKKKSYYYLFRINNNHKSMIKKFDYYAFVCLDENHQIEKYYFVPKEVIKGRKIISIPRTFKQNLKNRFSLKEYENNLHVIHS
jgi:hypothetical protein